MREILFRGKRVDNGEWVYGNYAFTDVNGEKHFIFQNKPLEHEVVPETVGQYTGLTDKNGKKIFEGDLIKTKEFGKCIRSANVNDYDIFEIKYKPAVFALVNSCRKFILAAIGADYEVIGNIHDNTELLKEE